MAFAFAQGRAVRPRPRPAELILLDLNMPRKVRGANVLAETQGR